MKIKNGAEYIRSLRAINPVIYYRGKRIKDVEMELNEAVIDLQKEGNTIERIEFFNVDTGKMIFLILYNNPNIKSNKNAAQ